MARLFVVSGPSGSGKTSLCNAWLSHAPRLKLSTSCTTRSPRPGEVDGREYHFMDVRSFEQLRRGGGFLEFAVVHGNHYGTRASDVAEMIGKGFDVLLEIDWQGAAQVAEKMPQAVRIFILPPSLAALKERLEERGQDDAQVVENRLAAAEAEMAHAGEAHFQVVNDDFDRALKELLDIYERN